MARPRNDSTQYRMSVHTNGKYRYACTQPRMADDEGKTYSKRIHWGTLDEKNVFHPNSAYLYLSEEERSRFIFPPDWSVEKAGAACRPRERGRETPESIEENRLYGDVWLLERVAEKTGLHADLMTTFGGNRAIVEDIETLAMYFVTTGHSCNRVARWQEIEKAPSKRILTPVAMTRLMQSIGEAERMAFMGLRSKRLKAGELCAVDTTSRSAYGDSLADIRWGKNKEGLALRQTNEMVVYGLESHMPVYYREFPGNMPDSRALDTMLADLDDAGFARVPVVSDRGFESIANLERLISRGQPFVSAVRTSTRQVYERILELGDFSGRPEGMTIDPGSRMYMRQWDIDYPVTASNGKSVRSDRLRLNLYFNPVWHAEHLVELDITVSEQEAMVSGMARERTKVTDPASLRRQCRFLIVDIAEDGAVKGCVRDEAKIDRSRRLAGFFAIMTHALDYDAATAKERYGIRDEQEKYYSQMKSMLGFNRQRNWSEDGKDGSRFIMFVGLSLSSYLKHIWKSTSLKKEFTSTSDVLDEMRSIRCIQHNGHHPRLTPFVGKQREICKAFGLEIPAGCDVAYKSRATVTKKRGRPAKQKCIKLDS